MRIASEKAAAAAAGPSVREQEMQSLNALLVPKGMKVYEIAADGHCMFRAIEDQIKYLDLSNSNQFLDRNMSFLDLRSSVAKQLRSHSEKYSPFWDCSELEHNDCSDCSDRDKFLKYCDEIEKTAKWGGHLELQALADAMSHRIEVYSADMPILSFGPDGREESADGPPIVLCYLKYAYGLGEHYNSIRNL